MDIFYNEIKKICDENSKVAMFVDMDGTIVEYSIYLKGEISASTKGKFIDGRPIEFVIDKLRKINEIENIDLYILTLAKTSIIAEEKKVWLKKYVDFIDEKNWIILDKEKGEYTSENKYWKKAEKMKEKTGYDCMILLDDDHKILKETKGELQDKGYAYHISSALI